jgi:siroheme synthase
MQIIVGSYKLQIVKKFLCELGKLLPALEFIHQEFVPVTELRDLSVSSDSSRDLASDKLLAALSGHQLAGAVYRSDMLPQCLPDEIDKFSLPDRYRVGDSLDSAAAVADLTLLYHRDDAVMPIIRNLLLPPVVFAGAGIGGIDNVTLGVIKALQNCDICVFDALIPDGIINFLPDAAEKIFVGKRRGRHYMKQAEINLLLVELARSGKKVVRLKGGDPSVFGRLAEEVASLQRDGLSFRVLPGITTLNVAAAGSGLLPSRRGVNRGFTVSTPRRAGSHDFVPLSDTELKESFNVYYMAANLVPEIVATMRADGFPADWPVSLIYDAGSWTETVICGTLADIETKISRPDLERRPALVLTGKSAAESYLFQTNAPLEKRRIICCGSEQKFYAQAKTAIENFGGKAVFVAAETLAGEGADIFKVEHAAVVFFDESSRQGYYDKFGSDALTGKIAAVVVADDCRPLAVVGKLSEPEPVLSAPDIENAVLRLAAGFSNRKIELECNHTMKMEISNGR